MKQYNIKFQIGKKRMQLTIEADSEEDAKYKLFGKIKVDSVEEVPVDKSVEYLKNIFGMK